MPRPQRATAVCPWGQRDSYTRREGSSLSTGLVEEAESSVLAPRLVPVSGTWRSPPHVYCHVSILPCLASEVEVEEQEDLAVSGTCTSWQV